MILVGCSTEATRGAAEGAKAGAAVGAVGGMVSALVFGGDIVDGAARGAVWGGSTGAASGAMQGAQVADQKRAADEKQAAAEQEKLRREIGDDAYSGLEALVDCKLPVALAYAETAKGNSKRDYALAGHWLEVLTLMEQGRPSDAEERLPDLVRADGDLETTESARQLLDATSDELGQIRVYYGLKRSCT
jgi:hypothetical protein